jgi:hypothetical protein
VDEYSVDEFTGRRIFVASFFFAFSPEENTRWGFFSFFSAKIQTKKPELSSEGKTIPASVVNSTHIHELDSGANPTIASYNASAVKYYNATKSTAHF